MKPILALLSIVALAPMTAHAGEIRVEIKLAQGKDSKPTTIFPANVPEVHAFFKTVGTKNGDRIRAVWFAEDAGAAAPKGTKIDEATVTGNEDNFSGSFSLSKPTKGWPIGEYRLEIYSGDNLVKTANFEITAPASAADADEEMDDVHKDAWDEDK